MTADPGNGPLTGRVQGYGKFKGREVMSEKMEQGSQARRDGFKGNKNGCVNFWSAIMSNQQHQQIQKEKYQKEVTNMLSRFRKNEKGFTLVELMIVVAIIGILAAIAIPQFAAYRVRGFNASAQSDVRNINTTEAAFFSDWQAYAISEQAEGATPDAAVAAAAGGTGPGAVINVADAGTNYPVLTGDDNGGTARAVQVPIGNGVFAVASTETPTAPALAVSFVAVAKHQQGDTFYGVDSDSTAIYQDSSAGIPETGPGYVLSAGDEPESTIATDDFAGVDGPSGNNWTVK